MNRSREIIRVSIMGIAANIVLVIFKAIVGFASNSTAVILDAVNNLSDALSSVITIVGTRLAKKKADKQHPFGHGRVEYVTSFIIAILILAAGFASLKESVEKIIDPPTTDFNWLSLAVIGAAIASKLLIGALFIKKGKDLNSTSLTASGTDANGDALISVATLISMLMSMLFGIELDGILGAVISAFIIKTGISIVAETISDIIGVRIDSELANGIKAAINEFPQVHGTYDLMLHSYGPEEYLGSVHIELDDDMSVKELDSLTRDIAAKIYSQYGVYLTIGAYATNTTDEETSRIMSAVREEISDHASILQMHGFYLHKEDRIVSFDLIVDFNEPNPALLIEHIRTELSGKYPEYTFHINLDRDISD